MREKNVKRRAKKNAKRLWLGAKNVKESANG